jgi:hypothetical protein
MSLPEEPISPELALVSPELGELARAQLTDRPWEMFVPPGPAPALPLAQELPVPAPLRSVRGSAVARPLPVSAGERGRPRPRIPIGTILLLAFVALIVTGSVLPTRDAPTLGPVPASAGTSASLPPAVRPDPAPPTGVAPQPSPVASAGPTGVPSASGYVLTNGKGFLQVAADGRSIVELQAVVPCVGTVVLHHIAIGSEGRFLAHRSIAGGAPQPLEVRGTVDLLRLVRGAIRVTAGPCRGTSLAFVARLS